MDRKVDRITVEKPRMILAGIGSKRSLGEGDRKAAAFMNSPGGKNGKHVWNGKYEQV
jgi:hypothetical protein